MCITVNNSYQVYTCITISILLNTYCISKDLQVAALSSIQSCTHYLLPRNMVIFPSVIFQTPDIICDFLHHFQVIHFQSLRYVMYNC